MFVQEVKSGNRIKVVIMPADSKELKKLINFEFDWNSEKSNQVFKLTISKSDEIIGLVSVKRIVEELRLEIRLLEISKENVGKLKRFEGIAGILIAYACKLSFQNGFFGFVSLVPKTKLIDHYKNKYGFKQFGRHLAIELNDSENLMNKYFNYEG